VVAVVLRDHLRVGAVANHREIVVAALELELVDAADDRDDDVLGEDVGDLGDVRRVEAAEIFVLDPLDRLDVLEALNPLCQLLHPARFRHEDLPS
jgi:hypothetical protein